MNDLETLRLQLHAVDVAEGERIVAQSAGPADAWADDFPFDGDLNAVGAFLRATALDGEQRPFSYYMITRRADGRAIGGVGFKNRPEGGHVEIGYGLVPTARGLGYAAEAVATLVAIARNHELSKVTANTTLDNIASQKTLVRAGFSLVRSDSELHFYEIVLDNESPRD